MDPHQSPGSFYGCSNFVDLLRFRAEHQADDLAYTYLVDGETEELHVSYAELDRRARAVGALLQSMGMEGERAMLLYPAGIDFIAAFFGCLYAGVVAVPAYPPRRNRKMTRIEGIGASSEAKIALAIQPVLEQVENVIEQTPELTRIKWAPTDELAPRIEDRWRHPPVYGDTIAFLQYTSGSTGVPKGVMLTHTNLMHNSAQICYAFEHTRSHKGVFWLPSYHDMGLIGGILQPLFVGRPNVLMSPMSFLQRPFRWLDAISRYRGSTSGGPNFAYELCVEKITDEQKESLDLSSWGVAFNGAEPIRSDTLERFVEAFEPCGFRREAFYPCYGLAEGTLIVTGGLKIDPPVVRRFDGKGLEEHRVAPALVDDSHTRRLVGCGATLLDQKVVIADPETMTNAAPGMVGEIWVAGPSVAKGYWKMPEETEATFHAYLRDTGDGPFMRTGDLGFVDDGELFVTGRVKDLIIVRGVNYYPQDIEQTVADAHPRVRSGFVAAFALDDSDRERVVIVAEVQRRSKDHADEIIEAIRREVAVVHQLPPDAVVLLKAGGIPTTSSGKIQRHAARDGFRDGALDVVGQWTAWQARPETGDEAPAPVSASAGDEAPKTDVNQSTLELVLEHVRRVAKDRAAGLTPDTNIIELGLDSLERVEIVASLEEHFGGRFPDDVLTEIETPREVAAAVGQHLGADRRHRKTIPDDQPIPPEYYQFDNFPEVVQLRRMADALTSAGLVNPYFQVHESVANDTTVIDGQELINFASFNYLGMSGDPVVTEAAKAAVDQFGASVSASRLVSGEKTLHRDLERAIAEFVGVDDSILFVSGHTANVTTIGHLFGPGDLILHDALAHNCILQGAMLSGARKRSFPHNDWRAVDEILDQSRRQYRRVLIAIEGVYSMDGDIADVPRFVEVKQRHNAMLLIDEAHSIGVLGPHGRGVAEHFELDAADIDLLMGNISKAMGSCGGYMAGCRSMIEYLKYTAPAFVYSTGISPANTAAGLAAIRLLESEPERIATLFNRAEQFLDLAKRAGMDTGLAEGTPIVPVITRGSERALRLSEAMRRRGVNVQPILYPAVEDEAARLRFFINSVHSEDQVRYTVDALAEEMTKVDPDFAARRAAAASRPARPVTAGPVAVEQDAT